MTMRFVCEIGNAEHLVDAETPEHAAREIAEAQARRDALAPGQRRRYTVNVAEANGADFPLIAGEDYTVTVEAPATSDAR